MKAVDARNLQHHLGSSWTRSRGGTQGIRSRRKAIGHFVPFAAKEPAASRPELQSRLERIYPDGSVAPGASAILYGDRN